MYTFGSAPVHAQIRRAAVLVSTLIVIAALSTWPVQATSNRYTQISAGGEHTCALTTRGEAYCWGDNDDGELGDGTTSASDEAGPQRVIGGLRFKSISAGDRHTCALTTRGEAYCWGNNNDGELGDGTTNDSDGAGPQRVIGGLRWKSILASTDFTCALSLNGSAYCWGDNAADGYLGDGTTASSNENGPQLVIGGHRFISISTQEDFTCGLTSRGEAYCWGNNLYSGNSQLGDGTNIDSGVNGPQKVIGGLRFAAIAVGSDGACALTPRRETYCWGEGETGGRGDGLLIDDFGGDLIGGPVAVIGGHQFARFPVTAGEDHRCALTARGEAYCWGGNWYGQLGDGTIADSDERGPLKVIGGLRFSSISVGEEHTCAITTRGEAYCWGGNEEGELGDGTTIASGGAGPQRVQ